MYPFFDQIFLKLQCSFRKGFTAVSVKVLTCLIHMIEKWRKYLDTGGWGNALLTDLSKAFDFVDHQLLIAKLNAHSADTNSLCFLVSYLDKRKQRTKVNGSYNNFDYIFSGVPEGFILGTLLFNIDICALFFFFGIGDLYIASYADDNTPYTFSSELDVALKKTQKLCSKSIGMVS